jgi:type IV pilus assembly protein PilQ
MRRKPAWIREKVGAKTLPWVVLAIVAAGLPAMGQDAPEPQAEPAAPSLLEVLGKAAKAAVGVKPAATAPAEEVSVETVTIEGAPVADTPEETADIRVSPQGRVEMHVRDLDLASVLQMLSIQSHRNIVASKDVSGKVTANLYNVTFEEALTAILNSNGCGWRENGNFIYVYTAQEIKDLQAAARQQATRIFRLHYTRAADAQVIVQPLLSTEGKASITPASDTGVAANSDGAGGNGLANDDCLLVIDYPERIEAVAKALSEIDVRPKQILIEATILRAQLTEDNSLGIDFNLVGGVDFQNLSSASPAMTDITTGALPTAKLQDTTFTTRTDFNDSVPNGGFTFGIIKDSVAVFVRALEQVTDTTVLANPKILTLNKQRGEVIVGRRDGYLTTTVTETSAIQSVEFLETGTQLRFRPFVGDDGYVRVEVHPEDSTGGLTAANLPFESTTEVTTNIIVRDGHTILIGGLFREVTTARRGQVPIVGNLPVAGALFRNSNDITQREEVIILLTIHVIKDSDAMSEASAQANEDVERYRVGMRNGLLGIGRERLAQAHYHWALEHLAKGHCSRALWDLELALNNNPKFMAAIKLKEKLTDKRAWDDESSSTRGFLTQQIMKESGVVTPMFGRPGPPYDFPLLEGPNGFDEGNPPPSPPKDDFGADSKTSPAKDDGASS